MISNVTQVNVQSGDTDGTIQYTSASFMHLIMPGVRIQFSHDIRAIHCIINSRKKLQMPPPKGAGRPLPRP